MRINSICVIQPNKLHSAKKKMVQNQITNGLVNEKNCPTFKGNFRWGGAVGTLFGTIAGITVAVASGGVLAPLVLGAAGAVGGDIIDRTTRPETSKEEEESRDFNAEMDTNYRDY